MSFFTDARIGARIAASLVAPIAGLLIFSGLNLVERQTAVTSLEKVERLAVLAPTISALVHEMQKERGTSAGFIGSKGAKFADTLPAQRKDTDATRQAMNAALDAFPMGDYSARFGEKMKAARTGLAELDAKRAGIDKLTLSVGQMAGYYTPTIRKFLTVIEEMSVLSTDALVTQRIGAYTAFMQAKERAGVERAMGAGGFGAGKFAPAVFNNFVGLIAEQNAFLGQFHVYATREEEAFLKKTLSGGPIDAVERMRKVAIASMEGGDLGGIDGATWFDTITAKIDLMKKVEDHLAADLGTEAAHEREIAHTAFLILLAATIALIAITAVLVTVIVRGITGPIAGMTGAMAALAQGDKTIDIPGVGRGDEIGGMAAAVQVFKDNMIKAEELSAREEWDNRVRAYRQTALMRMMAGFKAMVIEMLDRVGASSKGMQTSSGEMKAVADETNQRSITVAAAAEEASANVEAVASAAEELSSSINEISRQVAQSTQISSQAVQDTERANVEVRGLSDAAQKIGEVVSLISDIAEQTNLLALNATIEAARAGDAGKGFAVVASEVKNLANQTAKATEEIAAQIGGVQSATQDAVVAIQGIATTISQVNEIASAIAAAVEEQGAATQEIARNVEQAASGTQDVSANIISVKNSAEQTTETAENVGAVADELTALSGDLRMQIEKFLTAIE